LYELRGCARQRRLLPPERRSQLLHTAPPNYKHRRIAEVAVPANVWLPIFALLTWLLAAALVYSASPRQRWLRVPLPAFPTRVSAVLAVIVGVRAWAEALRFLS
jgi:hypothetical protein